MFIIDGMEKVRCIIKENRKRKLTKDKKLSNNTVIEMDNCSTLEIVMLQKNLLRIAEKEGADSRMAKENISRRSRSSMRGWRNAASV